jgi:hypothetical protein
MPEVNVDARAAQMSPQGIGEPSTQQELRREWLSYRDCETLAALSRTTLWKLVNAGEIEAARVGPTWLTSTPSPRTAVHTYRPNSSSPTRLTHPALTPRRARPIATLDSAPAARRWKRDAYRSGPTSSATSATIVSPIVTTNGAEPRSLLTRALPSSHLPYCSPGSPRSAWPLPSPPARAPGYRPRSCGRRAPQR